jgi:hypothetical protein
MSPNNERRGGGQSFVRRWWMAIAGVGVLIVIVASQSSDAASFSTSRWRHHPTRTTTSSPSTTSPTTSPSDSAGSGTTTTTSPAPLEILANNCDNSQLQHHDGFQLGNKCVTTEFGEVASQENNPTLLIANAPTVVRANTAFDLQVSTRNLVRDRFLPAGQGGYYKESSLLTDQGLTRGHFHTACRMLTSNRTAPDPAPQPAFFVATEDKKGGATPDTVTVRVSGLPRGIAQCAVWAGDGSHRIPMMQRANQIPAIDVVRIIVR